MSTDFEDIIKQGYLKVKSKGFGTWNKRWVILKKASSKGPSRLEKYQDERTSSINKIDPKSIHLSDVKSVSMLPSDVKKYTFAIFFNNNSSKQYSAESDTDANTWCQALTTECEKAKIAASQNSVQQSKEMFNVYLLPSPKLDIFGECLLHVSEDQLILYDVAGTHRKLVFWPLTALRRYGKDESKFTIEAGRHCQTGEGIFLFNTNEAGIIYSKVHSASVAISAAHRIAKQGEQPMSGQSTLTRNLSDSGPSLSSHAPLQGSLSFPETRAPLPLPRGAPPTPNRSGGSEHSNTSNSLDRFAAGNSFQVSYSQRRPAVTNNNNDPGLEIYEEKYLEPEFRRFLSGRKDDES